MTRVTLDVQYACASPGLPDRRMFGRWVRAAVADAETDKAELVVRIVDEQECALLNERYRHKHGPTNVLSFRYAAPGNARAALRGDIVICAPVVAREARAQDKAETAHWAHMVVHGIMHLRGYDHAQESDARIMEAEEARVLGRLGFPDPYL